MEPKFARDSEMTVIFHEDAPVIGVMTKEATFVRLLQEWGETQGYSIEVDWR